MGKEKTSSGAPEPGKFEVKRPVVEKEPFKIQEKAPHKAGKKEKKEKKRPKAKKGWGANLRQSVEKVIRGKSKTSQGVNRLIRELSGQRIENIGQLKEILEQAKEHPSKEALAQAIALEIHRAVKNHPDLEKEELAGELKILKEISDAVAEEIKPKEKEGAKNLEELERQFLRDVIEEEEEMPALATDLLRKETGLDTDDIAMMIKGLRAKNISISYLQEQLKEAEKEITWVAAAEKILDALPGDEKKKRKRRERFGQRYAAAQQLGAQLNQIITAWEAEQQVQEKLKTHEPTTLIRQALNGMVKPESQQSPQEQKAIDALEQIRTSETMGELFTAAHLGEIYNEYRAAANLLAAQPQPSRRRALAPLANPALSHFQEKAREIAEKIPVPSLRQLLEYDAQQRVAEFIQASSEKLSFQSPEEVVEALAFINEIVANTPDVLQQSEFWQEVLGKAEEAIKNHPKHADLFTAVRQLIYLKRITNPSTLHQTLEALNLTPGQVATALEAPYLRQVFATINESVDHGFSSQETGPDSQLVKKPVSKLKSEKEWQEFQDYLAHKLLEKVNGNQPHGHRLTESSARAIARLALDTASFLNPETFSGRLNDSFFKAINFAQWWENTGPAGKNMAPFFQRHEYTIINPDGQEEEAGVPLGLGYRPFDFTLLEKVGRPGIESLGYQEAKPETDQDGQPPEPEIQLKNWRGEAIGRDNIVVFRKNGREIIAVKYQYEGKEKFHIVRISAPDGNYQESAFRTGQLTPEERSRLLKRDEVTATFVANALKKGKQVEKTRLQMLETNLASFPPGADAELDGHRLVDRLRKVARGGDFLANMSQFFGDAEAPRELVFSFEDWIEMYIRATGHYIRKDGKKINPRYFMLGNAITDALITQSAEAGLIEAEHEKRLRREFWHSDLERRVRSSFDLWLGQLLKTPGFYSYFFFLLISSFLQESLNSIGGKE